MSIIARICEGCEREDCRIRMDGGGVTTCMAFTPEYDRQGRRVSFDPNTTTMGADCATCGREWSVIHHDGEQAEIKLLKA